MIILGEPEASCRDDGAVSFRDNCLGFRLVTGVNDPKWLVEQAGGTYCRASNKNSQSLRWFHHLHLVALHVQYRLDDSESPVAHCRSSPIPF